MDNEVPPNQHVTGPTPGVVQIPQAESTAEGGDDYDTAGAGSGPIVDSPGTRVLEVGDGDPKPEGSWQNPLRNIGVEQIRYEYRCKICQLSGKAPTVYKRLHELVYVDRMSWNSAMNEINTYIKQHGLQIAMFNAVNMHTHFNKHIRIENAIVAAMDKIDGARATPVAPEAVRELIPMVQNAAKSDIDDFRNLDLIRQKITAQLEKLESQLDVVDPKTQKLKLDKWALDLYTRVVRETRACISDLNEMRKSERLMNSVVQALLDRLTFAIIPQLLAEYTLIGEELQHARVPDDVIKRIDERLRKKTAEVIATTARAAVIEVQRQFKLK